MPVLIAWRHSLLLVQVLQLATQTLRPNIVEVALDLLHKLIAFRWVVATSAFWMVATSVFYLYQPTPSCQLYPSSVSFSLASGGWKRLQLCWEAVGCLVIKGSASCANPPSAAVSPLCSVYQKACNAARLKQLAMLWSCVQEVPASIARQKHSQLLKTQPMLRCPPFPLCYRYLQGAAHYVTADRQHEEDVLGSKQHHAGTDAPASAATSDATAGSSGQPGAQVVSPQGLAVQIICSCDEIPDEGVEVLVLRGLLTATTSLTFTLHGQALLLAVRTCYNIHLMSRSEVNQTTAKATLTQMLNVVFQRMEAGSVMIQVSPAACWVAWGCAGATTLCVLADIRAGSLRGRHPSSWLGVLLLKP